MPVTRTAPNAIHVRARRRGTASGSAAASGRRRSRERRNGGRNRGGAGGLLLAPRTQIFATVRAFSPRKLSLRQTLRHRFSAMTYIKFEDEDESSGAGT